MATFDYKELSRLPTFIGIKTDYNALKAYLGTFDDNALVVFYNRIRQEVSPMEAIRYLNIVIDIADLGLSTNVMFQLLKDNDLIRCLEDKRCKPNFVFEKLKEYKEGIPRKKEEEKPKEDPTETYTYHGFEFRLDNGRIIRIIFSKERLKELKLYAKRKDEEKMIEFFAPYGIDPNTILATIPSDITISKRKNDSIRKSLATGVLNAASFDFINQINPNFAVVSQEELKQGLTEERINEVLGDPEITHKEVTEQPVSKPRYKTKVIYDSVYGTVKDLGTQEMFIGQPMNIECVFNVYDLECYIVRIPGNEFVSYDRLTGVITPLSSGKVKISIKNMDNQQIKEITLSVNQSIRHSISSYVADKKKKILTNEQKDNQ